jgi:DNA polymerase iota
MIYIVIAPLLDPLRLRLHLGSHLAQHLREALHSQKGYTCTAGISTNKELSKLVGNLHKPHAQTTLLPPYESEYGIGNVALFLDRHEVGKIPGIGFKIAQKLREIVQLRSNRQEDHAADSNEAKVLVSDIKGLPDINAELLEQKLRGPGTPLGTGIRIWDLLHGRDDTEVGQARDVPRQISLEDSYGRLDTEEMALKELHKLAASLIKRMHADLVSTCEENEGLETTATRNANSKRWLAFPKTVRLSTCPRAPPNPDGTRNRSTRISRSAPMPNFIFSFKEPVNLLADRLVTDVLVHLFRKLHPDKNWNLSIINIAATNIVDAASEKGGPGRDIAIMFRRQDNVLKQCRVDPPANKLEAREYSAVLEAEPSLKDKVGSEDVPTRSQEEQPGELEGWQSGDEDMTEGDLFTCERCDAVMPVFAMAAHDRWHAEN